MDFKMYKDELKEQGYDVTVDNQVVNAYGNIIAGVGAYDSWFIKDDAVQAIMDAPKKRVRARDDKGRLVGDDPSTPDINEAWV